MEESKPLCYNCKSFLSPEIIKHPTGNSDRETEYDSNEKESSKSSSFTWQSFDLKRDNSKILEIFKPLEDLSSGLAVMNDIKVVVDSAAHQLGNKFREVSKAVSKSDDTLDDVIEKSSISNSQLLDDVQIPEDIILCSNCRCFSAADSDVLCNDYLIIQHGFMDSPKSLVYISYALIRDYPHLNIYLAYNSYGNTYMSIDSTSYIFSNELIRWFELIHFDYSNKNVKPINISLLGHSLGSLIIMGALEKLEESMLLVSSGKIKFVNFISVTSPMFGTYESSTVLKSTVNIFNTDVLNDLDYKTEALIRLYSYNIPKLLFSFERIIMYGNAKNDTLVGPRTSLSLPVNMYNDEKLTNLIAKCVESPNTYVYVPMNYKFTNDFCEKIIPKSNINPLIQESEILNMNSSEGFYEIINSNENYNQLVETHKDLLIEYLTFLKDLDESSYVSLNVSGSHNNSNNIFIELELFETIEKQTGISLSDMHLKPSPLYQLLIAFFELITSTHLSSEEYKFDNMYLLHMYVLMMIFIIKDINKKVERYMVYVPTLNPHRHIISRCSFLIVSDSYLSLAKHIKSIKCFD